MNHSVKRRRQALHQTPHHYYLNISVEAANLSDWRIESNRKNRFGSENRIESKLFCPNWNALLPALWITVYRTASNYEVLFHKSFKIFRFRLLQKNTYAGGVSPCCSHSLHTVECRLEAALAVSCCSPWLQSSFILLSVSEPARISCGYTEWELSNKTVGSLTLCRLADTQCVGLGHWRSS